MLPCRIGEVIDALIDLYRLALDGVLVIDGPEEVDVSSVFEYVVIGDEVDDDTGSESTWNQSWAGLGAQSKTENGTVLCTVAVRSGDSMPGAIKRSRDRALAILGVCETAHRANVNLGGLVLFSAIESGGYRPVSDSEGTGADVTFNVTYEARI